MAGQTYSKNQFGEASISVPLPIGSSTGPLMVLPTGAYLLAGAGSPNTVITAPVNSLYLRSDGTGLDQVLYVNTDGATAWTAAKLAT